MLDRFWTILNHCLIGTGRVSDTRARPAPPPTPLLPPQGTRWRCRSPLSARSTTRTSYRRSSTPGSSGASTPSSHTRRCRPPRASAARVRVAPAAGAATGRRHAGGVGEGGLGLFGGGGGAAGAAVARKRVLSIEHATSDGCAASRGRTVLEARRSQPQARGGARRALPTATRRTTRTSSSARVTAARLPAPDVPHEREPRRAAGRTAADERLRRRRRRQGLFGVGASGLAHYRGGQGAHALETTFYVIAE